GPTAAKARAARRAAAATATGLLAWALMAPPAWGANASSLVAEGNRLYREGKLQEALEAYQQAEKLDPSLPAIQYNIGNILYRMQQYDQAYDRYRKAFSAEQGPLAEGARYNAGNTHFARKNWPEAIRHYKDALKLDPTDVEAKKNLELALRAMEEQKQQQQQKQDQDQDQQDQNQPQQQPERPQDQKEQDAPQPREQRPQQEQQKLSRQEAMRILDAMKELDRPPKDPMKVPPPDKKPEKDW
ncbi:MAG: tetratricopeptide repeat protein, partial [Candidatus Polarisedimenticolia bacterium]